MSAEPSQPFYAGNFIKYHPVIKQEFGSHNAALLFDRLEYWFSRIKNQFYKFIKPCDHPLYKEGDSWEEELGLSPKAFRNAFDLIGIRYKSKTEFNTAEDPFKGKLFAYYQDRQSKKTIFVRNNKLLNVWYENLKEKIAVLTQKINAKIKAKVTKNSENPPREAPKGCPHVRATIDKQKSLSSEKKRGLNSSKEKNNKNVTGETSQTVLDMKDIWIDVIGDKGLTSFTPNVAEKALKALEANFQGSLKQWRAHCLKIASSKFLMGEKDNTSFEIKFFYAISGKFVNELNEGKYELNTRETKESPLIRDIENKTKFLLEKIKNKEQILYRIKQDKKLYQRNVLNQAVKNISPEDRERYKPEYEAHMKVSSCGQAYAFQKYGWEGAQTQFNFDTFIQKKLKASLPENWDINPELEERERQIINEKNRIQELYELGLNTIKDIKNGVMAYLNENNNIFAHEIKTLV